MRRPAWVLCLLVGLLAIGGFYLLSAPWDSVIYDSCSFGAALAFWFCPAAAGSPRVWCWRLLAIGAARDAAYAATA